MVIVIIRNDSLSLYLLVDYARLLQLRVVKAFRSSLEDFDERRSIASTHSMQSMRLGGWGGSSKFNLSDEQERKWLGWNNEKFTTEHYLNAC